MPEITESAQHGLTRRTALKAAAWSAPVVAATLAVPAHAASAATVDLGLTIDAGEGYSAVSPDGTRGVDVGTPIAYLAYSNGAEIPAGATFVLSTDTRNLGAPTVTVNDAGVTGTSSTSGNVRTTTYVIPVPIPAGGPSAGARIIVRQDIDKTYFEDLNPIIATALVPNGFTDSDSSNNSATSAPRYGDIADLRLAVAAGDTLTASNPDGRTWTLDTPTNLVAYSETVAVPAGTALQVWFDSRILGDPTVALLDGTVLTPTDTRSSGNRQTMFYALPAIPAAPYPDGVRFSINFGTRTSAWFDDLDSHGITLSAGPGVVDPDLSNNDVFNSVVYS
jgi:hypothetical protein